MRSSLETTGSRLVFGALAAIVVLAGCAPQRPVLYPNAKLDEVGTAAAERDIDECIALAEQSGAGTGQGQVVAERTATAGAIGAAGGAAAGAVRRGHAGRGAAAGAAGGAAGGFVASMLQTRRLDPVTKRWVEACLQERGYRTIGWK